MPELLRTKPFAFAAVLALTLLVANIVAEPSFGDPGNWPAQLAALAPFAIVALASTPQIVSGGGGIDISVGPITVLTNVVLIEWFLDSSTFDAAWHFMIPEHGADRMGREGALFELAQWYPRVCVYDDVRGWNTEPYLGQGEFYL